MHPSSTPKVDIDILPSFNRRVTKTWLRNIVTVALGKFIFSRPVSISIFIADDSTLKELNLRYRGIDETTDVLAFSFHDSLYDEPEDITVFDFPSHGTDELGDIVISYPQAIRQAKENKKTIHSELALLLVHGVLHIMGYDHAEEEDERVMWAKQDEILEMVTLP